MLVNFALELLGTKVSSNKVNTDGYECTNLISSDVNERRKGYLAEHFIKPPVDITLIFPCNINIYCILLNPFVGRQQSSFLEIYSATKPWPKSQIGNEKRLSELKGNGQHSSQTQSSEENLPIYHPLCKTNLPIQTRVCFYNRRFPSYISSRRENLLSSVDTSASYEIRSGRADLLTSCTHLMIRIARTQSGSTPAISNIEIWGSVSSQVNKEVHSIIINKFETYNESSSHQNCLFMEHVNEVSSSSGVSVKEKEDSEKQNLDLNCDDSEIPEEFLDSLTCEIMAIPMLLPSGKNVDKLTLDRYFDSEASHGRLPRDPFTGVEFHGISKPLPNMPLKARIDRFLSENRNKPSLASLPRTVVSGSERINSQRRKRKIVDSSVPQVSSVVHNSDSDNKISKLCSNSNFLKQNNDCTGILSSYATFHSSPHSSLASTSTSKFMTDEAHSHPQHSIKETPSMNSADHESSLKDSLNQALFAVLDSSSKTNSTEITDSIEIPYSDTLSIPKHNVLCSKCGQILSEEVVSYMTPCSHFLCRPCLMSQNAAESKIICHTCEAVCLKSQVVRTHSRINNCV